MSSFVIKFYSAILLLDYSKSFLCVLFVLACLRVNYYDVPFIIIERDITIVIFYDLITILVIKFLFAILVNFHFVTIFIKSFYLSVWSYLDLIAVLIIF